MTRIPGTRWWRVVPLICLCLLLVTPARAHKASDAYASVGGGGAGMPLTVQLSLALKDLDAAIESLDANDDRQLEWGEVRTGMPAIVQWLNAGLSWRCGDAALGVAWAFESLERRSDGVYVRLAARPLCEGPQALEMDYQLMKGVDPTHRLLLSGTVDARAVAVVLAPEGRGRLVLRGKASAAPQSGPATLAAFFPEGIHHIVTGYDHLAFLLVLLLPIRLRRDPVLPELAQRPGLLMLLTTVTGFTVGHSITLVAATLGWIASPGWVEPAIAITIAASALLNLYPQRWARGDLLALGFGLVHGLGFSNIMREADVSGALLPWALAGFNLGVEAGQLVGVAVWCALHLVLLRWRAYEAVVVRGGSWALFALALFWTAQRLWSA